MGHSNPNGCEGSSLVTLMEPDGPDFGDHIVGMSHPWRQEPNFEPYPSGTECGVESKIKKELVASALKQGAKFDKWQRWLLPHFFYHQVAVVDTNFFAFCRKQMAFSLLEVKNTLTILPLGNSNRSFPGSLARCLPSSLESCFFKLGAKTSLLSRRIVMV